MQVLGRRVRAPGEHRPADAVAAGAVDLGQARERGAQRVVHQRRHRHELGVRVGHLVIDLVAEDARDRASRRAAPAPASTARGYTAPVGLLGLMMTRARVRGVTSRASSSGSGTKPFSGRHG